MQSILRNRKLANVSTTNTANKVTDKIYGICAALNLISLFLIAGSCLTIVKEVKKEKEVFLFTNDGRVIEYKGKNDS